MSIGVFFLAGWSGWVGQWNIQIVTKSGFHWQNWWISCDDFIGGH